MTAGTVKPERHGDVRRPRRAVAVGADDTMVARSVGAKARAGFPLGVPRAEHVPELFHGMRKRSRRLEILSSSDLELFRRTHVHQDWANGPRLTRSQGSGTESRVCPAGGSDGGEGASPNGARLAPPFCDFCSASFCAPARKMAHAMSDRHTVVVSDPPIFVMCMAMAPQRTQPPRPDVARPRRLRARAVPDAPLAPHGAFEEVVGKIFSVVARWARCRKSAEWAAEWHARRVCDDFLGSQTVVRQAELSLPYPCGAGRDKVAGKPPSWATTRGSLHRAKASSFEP